MLVVGYDYSLIAGLWCTGSYFDGILCCTLSLFTVFKCVFYLLMICEVKSAKRLINVGD